MMCDRGAYCAATVARLTGIATAEMFDGTAAWIVLYVAFDFCLLSTAEVFAVYYFL